MISSLVVLLIQLLYFCAANTIYDGPCDYVNDSLTHGAITHIMRTYLEDAIFIPDIARNPLGSGYADGFYQISLKKRLNNGNWRGISHTHVKTVLEELLIKSRSQLNVNDDGIPYGCKAIKCSLEDSSGIDVEVSCAIGKTSAMLTEYFLKRHFEEYFKTLHSALDWDKEMAKNALNEKFVKDKKGQGYLWSKVTREISRVDYYELSDLVSDIIPTLFTEKEKKTIKSYKMRYTKYGCLVQVNRKNENEMNVACLLYAKPN